MALQVKPRKAIPLLAAVVLLVLLMLYMAGSFRTGVIQPGREEAGEQEPPPKKTALATVEMISQNYEAVGTVRSEIQASISAQVSGRILSVSVRSGDMVEEGDPLIRIYDRDLQSRLDQAGQALHAAEADKRRAEQALIAAQAAYSEAGASYRRIKNYVEHEAATRQDMERAEAAHRQAMAVVEQAKSAVAGAAAGVEQAKKFVEEAQINLGYTRISAPRAGQIAKRLVDPGDSASPGKPLLLLQSTDVLRLEAHVREGLIGKLLPKSKLPVFIDALQARLNATLEEVVPTGDPSSRTFLVKVRLPAADGLYSGMFGRLYVPLEERRAVLVPRTALRRIGQLDVVRAEVDGRWTDLFVKTGRRMGDAVEILSGLSGNEKVAIWTEADE
jgi:RND family efflux transporter MFP subunit